MYPLNSSSKQGTTLPATDTSYSDHDGQRLRFVDFILLVPQSCPIAMPLLLILQLHKHKRIDSGTNKLKLTKPGS